MRKENDEGRTALMQYGTECEVDLRETGSATLMIESMGEAHICGQTKFTNCMRVENSSYVR